MQRFLLLGLALANIWTVCPAGAYSISGSVRRLPTCHLAPEDVVVVLEPTGRTAVPNTGAGITGWFAFTGVEAGHYVVSVSPECTVYGCYAPVPVNVDLDDVWLAPICPQEVDDLYTVTGLVENRDGCEPPPALYTVTLQPTGRAVSVGHGQRFVFAEVPPGTYTLSTGLPCTPFQCWPEPVVAVVDDSVEQDLRAELIYPDAPNGVMPGCLDQFHPTTAPPGAGMWHDANCIYIHSGRRYSLWFDETHIASGYGDTVGHLPFSYVIPIDATPGVHWFRLTHYQEPQALYFEAPFVVTGPDDADWDGLPDALEQSMGYTHWLLTDSDGDGLRDGEEDADADGRQDAGETDARNADSDGDGYVDGLEVRFFPSAGDPLDPAKPEGTWVDLDGDRLPLGVDGCDDLDPESQAAGYWDGYSRLHTGRDVGELGDVNGDDAITNADALAIQALFLGTMLYTLPFFDGDPQSPDRYRYSDTNGDGHITNLDALVAQQRFLLGVPRLPLRR